MAKKGTLRLDDGIEVSAEIVAPGLFIVTASGWSINDDEVPEGKSLQERLCCDGKTSSVLFTTRRAVIAEADERAHLAARQAVQDWRRSHANAGKK